MKRARLDLQDRKGRKAMSGHKVKPAPMARKDRPGKTVRQAQSDRQGHRGCKVMPARPELQGRKARRVFRDSLVRFRLQSHVLELVTCTAGTRVAILSAMRLPRGLGRLAQFYRVQLIRRLTA